MLSSLVDLLVAGAALVAAVTAGIVVNELSHVAALSASGVPCTVTLLPERGNTGALGASVPGAWATVTPTAVPDGFAPWRLRVAAMMPLCLLAPFALASLGVIPDPFGGGLAVQAAAVGWLGCALPSPSDFSLLWYPERALDGCSPDTAGDAVSAGNVQ